MPRTVPSTAPATPTSSADRTNTPATWRRRPPRAFITAISEPCSATSVFMVLATRNSADTKARRVTTWNSDVICSTRSRPGQSPGSRTSGRSVTTSRPDRGPQRVAGGIDGCVGRRGGGVVQPQQDLVDGLAAGESAGRLGRHVEHRLARPVGRGGGAGGEAASGAADLEGHGAATGVGDRDPAAGAGVLAGAVVAVVDQHLAGTGRSAAVDVDDVDVGAADVHAPDGGLLRRAVADADPCRVADPRPRQHRRWAGPAGRRACRGRGRGRRSAA